MSRLLQRLLLLVLLLAGPALRAETVNAVDPPPPVDLENNAGLGRQRIAARLESGEKAHALVIGIEAYEMAPWKRLPGVKSEVEAVIRALRVHGFNVVRLQGREVAPGTFDGRVTAGDIRKALGDFVRQYGQNPENRLIVYVASHGLAVREADAGRSGEATGFIIATDTPGENDAGFSARAVPVTGIAKDIAEIRARHLLIAFNTCFSGALVPAMRTRSAEPADAGRPRAAPLAGEVADWVETLLTRPAHLVMTAGDGNQTVPDEDAAFGRAFVEGLYGAADLDGDGLILAAELGQHVRSRVARETYKAGRPNDPLFVALPVPGEAAEGGDFVFLSPRGPAGAEVRRDHSALERKRAILPGGAFADCLDCPVMAELGDMRGAGIERRIAIGKTEVTAAQWSACFRLGFCRRWKSDAAGGDRPATHVTWGDALDYLDFLNAHEKPEGKCRRYRLPDAAEWRAAASGGSASRYGWGDAPVAGRANCAGCGSPWDGRSTSVVASFPPNAYGLHDMVGNVWEWVASPDPCGAVELAAGKCAPGRVMGGAYSTRIDAIDLSPLADRTKGAAGGTMPRPGLRNGSREPGWPTVGLRVACDLDAPPAH
ncbi:MAG: SUMF1/EgtB/PvdO family nonheme iron enzyme [Proteobacteria bacterium]|nr:SUMF1/EgtB/PvdO family nonheme iron enzyme [Pseudomonadota bacterium]